MWIKEKRDKLSELVRWRVQDAAWHSRCDSQVLYGAAVKCAEGSRALGYWSNTPPQNRDEQFYKEWIRDVTNPILHALYWWEFLDCSLDEARPLYEDAARRIRDCSANLQDIESDQPVLYPAHLTES